MNFVLVKNYALIKMISQKIIFNRAWGQ